MKEHAQFTRKQALGERKAEKGESVLVRTRRMDVEMEGKQHTVKLVSFSRLLFSRFFSLSLCFFTLIH